MGSNPGELLGAQDGQPSFSSTSVSSSCLTKFFLKFGSLGIGRLLFQDRRGGPSNFQNWLVLEWRCSQNDGSILWQSRNEILRSNTPAKSLQFSIGWSFSTLTKKPRLVSSRLGPSDGLVPQATGKRLDAYRRTNKQEDVQPYESGIDGALPQWLARVVLPRVLRFPPTKKDKRY